MDGSPTVNIQHIVILCFFEVASKLAQYRPSSISAAILLPALHLNFCTDSKQAVYDVILFNDKKNDFST